MAVIQPEGQLTWGGAVLPQIQTLSPRIRKAHGGHWWWWPLEIANTGVGLRDGMRRLSLDVATY